MVEMLQAEICRSRRVSNWGVSLLAQISDREGRQTRHQLLLMLKKEHTDIKTGWHDHPSMNHC